MKGIKNETVYTGHRDDKGVELRGVTQDQLEVWNPQFGLALMNKSGKANER